MLTICMGWLLMYMVVDSTLGDRDGLVMYEVDLRRLLLMYVATLGTLDEWSKIKVKPGEFSGLLLNKKGS